MCASLPCAVKEIHVWSERPSLAEVLGVAKQCFPDASLEGLYLGRDSGSAWMLYRRGGEPAGITRRINLEEAVDFFEAGFRNQFELSQEHARFVQMENGAIALASVVRIPGER